MIQDSLLADVTMDFWEHYIRRGKVFNFFHSATVNAAATVALVPLTSTKIAFAKINVDCNKSGVLTIQTGVTASSGSTVTGYNRDRNSNETTGVTAKSDPTISGAGTTIRTIVMGAAGSKEELIRLAPSTKYSIIFTADGNTTTASINLDVYEE